MLTDSQKQTLHNDMLSRPELSTMISSGDDIALASYYNNLPLIDWIVWRTRVSQEEYQSSISSIGTTFSWSGTGGYIARTQGERDAWRAMFVSGTVNPSLTNIILGFNDIFSGTGAQAINNRNHLAALSKRKASIVEQVLSTGSGVGLGTDVLPATLTFEGKISYIEISEARVWQ